MKFLPVHLFFVMLFTPLCTVAKNQEGQQLEADKRLNSSLSVAYLCTDLQSLCKTLSSKEVSLKADDDCKHIKVHLRLINRPCYQILRAIEEWLPGRWEELPDKSGYLLVRSSQATKNHKEWWETFLRVRQAAITAEAQQMTAEMRLTPQQRPTLFNALDTPDPYRPDPNQVRTFFNMLPEELKQKAAERKVNPADYSKEQIASSGQEETNAFTFPMPQTVLPFFHSIGVRLPTDTFIRFRSSAGSVNANFFSDEGERVYSTLALALTDYFPSEDVTRLNTDMIRTVKMRGNDSPADWRRLAEFQKQTVWKNTLPPSQTERQNFVQPDLEKHKNLNLKKPLPPFSGQEPRSRAAIIGALTADNTTEFLADYYTTSGKDEEIPVMLTEPVKEEEWNRFALDYDSSWKQSGTLRLIRNNRWYRDDPLEVPHDLVKQWITKYEADDSVNLISPGLDKSVLRLREFSRSLTLWQIANGLLWTSRREQAETPKTWERLLAKAPRKFASSQFHNDTLLLLQMYDIVVFCNTLSEPLWEQLVLRQLPLTVLTVTQKAALLKAVPALADYLVIKPHAFIIIGLDYVGTYNPAPGIVWTRR